MTLVKRNGSLLNPLPVLFDDFFNQDLFNQGNSNISDTNTTIPAVYIKETAEGYEVEVAAPGMTKKDFKVELDGNLLTIGSKEPTKMRKRKMNVMPVKNSVINLSKKLSPYRKMQWTLTKFRRSMRMVYCIFLFPKKGKQNKSHQGLFKFPNG